MMLLAAVFALGTGSLQPVQDRTDWAVVVLRRATVDITPPEALPLGGYTERGAKVSEPGGSHLYARAILLRQGSVEVFIVSAEMLTVPESLAREVRKRIPSDVHVFLCATHTHSAPDSQILNERMTLGIPGIANFRPRWLEWYADKIASAYSEATKDRLGSKVPTILPVVFDPQLNRGRRKDAFPDPTGTVITDSLMEPILAVYAAHPVVLDANNLKLSGDWPGVFANLIQAPVLMGAIGDVSPKVDESRSREDRLVRYARSLFSAYWSRFAFLPEPSAKSTAPLKVIEEEIPLAPAVAHPDFARTNGIPDVLAQSIVGQFAPREAKIMAVRMGKVVLVGVPGEPTSHLGREIRDYGRRLGFPYTLVISHVNGWMGYILGPVDYDRGGYEATLSFYGREQGIEVVQAAKRALDRLR